MLKVAYFNVQGLTASKLLFIESLFTSSLADIVVISEHWFSSYNNLTNSPFFVTSTGHIAKKTGHANCGIALLCSSSLRKCITIQQHTEFYIQFLFQQVSLTALYLPPRLQNDTVRSLLHQVLPSKMIFGDINVRFGAAFDDTSTTAASRGSVFYNTLLPAQFQHIKSKTQCSRNDHVFSVIPCTMEYEWFSRDIFASDHGLMTMELSIESPVAASVPNIPRYAFRLLKEEACRSALKSYYDSMMHKTLLPLIHATRNELVNMKTYNRAIKEDFINTLYSCFTDSIYSLLDEFIPQYDPIQVKSNYDPTIVLESQCSNTEAIRAFKRSQRAYAAKMIVRVRDATKNVEQEAFSFYSSLYQSENVEMPEAPEPPSTDDAAFLFTTERVKKAIEYYPSSKSGGPDRIHVDVFKCLMESTLFAEMLSQLLQLFYEVGITPKSWNESNIFLLLKDVEQPFVDKTRPVALTNILRRIFEKILLGNWASRSWSKLHPSQSGFKKGWSTISSILLSDDMSRIGFLISVFLDLCNAFDRALYTKILEILRARGCPTRDLSLIYSLMMHECMSFLIVNGCLLSKGIRRNRGILQGSVLSPFLFNIVIDVLADRVNGNSLVPRMLLFADDIVIKARSFKECQEILNICYQWSSENNMEWNINKCGSVGSKAFFTLNGVRIPQVVSYKYLGLPHGKNGILWADYCMKITEKISNFLKSLSLRKKTWSFQARLIIYKTFIRSTGEYCLPLLLHWISRDLKPRSHLLRLLEDTHKEGLTWIFDTATPKLLLEFLSGLGSLQKRVTQLQGSLAYHLQSLDPENPLKAHSTRHFLSTNHDSILLPCFSNPDFKKWQLENSTSQEKITWSTWCRRKWLNDVFESPGILQHYILPSASSGSMNDSILRRPLGEAERMLAWRCNSCFSRAKCPVCSKPFNRAHLSRCSLYKLLGNSYEPLLTDKKFRDDLDKISKGIPPKKKFDESNYTLLDYYLNHQLNDDFLSLYTSLRTLLYDKPSTTD